MDHRPAQRHAVGGRLAPRVRDRGSACAEAGLVSPGRPYHARVIAGRGVSHHPVQGTGFDLFHEPDRLVIFGRRLQAEPVAETNARENLIGEQHRRTSLRAVSVNDHFGVGYTPDERPALKRRECVTRLRAVADRLNGRPIEPGPAAMVKDPASFRVCGFGQSTRLTGTQRRPSRAESTLNRGALKLKIVFRVRRHDGILDAASLAAVARDRDRELPEPVLLNGPAVPEIVRMAAGVKARGLGGRCHAGEAPGDGRRVVGVTAEYQSLAAGLVPPPHDHG